VGSRDAVPKPRAQRPKPACTCGGGLQPTRGTAAWQLPLTGSCPPAAAPFNRRSTRLTPLSLPCLRPCPPPSPPRTPCSTDASSAAPPPPPHHAPGLHEMLLQSEHRTLDPSEADFFYLPVRC
jgi:hypothetical protein